MQSLCIGRDILSGSPAPVNYPRQGDTILVGIDVEYNPGPTIKDVAISILDTRDLHGVPGDRKSRSHTLGMHIVCRGDTDVSRGYDMVA
jgi:hypothetical protein